VPASLAVLADGWGEELRGARRHGWFELAPASADEGATAVPSSPAFDARLRASLAGRG
jgi:hypothetical protein